MYLSGGEISLCVDKIEYLLEALKRNHVPIYGIRFLTNAAEKSDRLCSIINRFAEYVTVKDCDCEPCKIFISTDQIHRENIPDLNENITFYQERCPYFYRFNDNADTTIFYIGNAEENYSLDDENVNYRPCHFEKIEYSDERHIMSERIFLDVNGELYVSDLPYKMRNKGEYEIANIIEDDIIDQIKVFDNSASVRILDPVYKAWYEFLKLSDRFKRLNTIAPDVLEIEVIINNFDIQLRKLSLNMPELKNHLAVRAGIWFINEYNSKQLKEIMVGARAALVSIDMLASRDIKEIKQRYRYVDSDFLASLKQEICKLHFEKWKLQTDSIVGLSKHNRIDSEKGIEELETLLMLACAQRNAEQYENQFKDHKITHNKYPQFTPKDCIMWDNSMKHLADKKGIAWKDPSIRKRHIDVIEKMKKEKLSPWEARLVRVS